MHFGSDFRRWKLPGNGLKVWSAIFMALSLSNSSSDELDPAQLASDILEGLKLFRVPGLALSVVRDDQVVIARGYGVREMRTDQAVDEHTLFGIASISKSFTAVCLGMLVDEGRLDWDDRVRRYLPDFELYDPVASREMTIRDLLTHRSGLHPVSGGTLWYGTDYSRAEVVHRLRYLRPTDAFRYRYAYQNTMYMVAGEVVEAISGVSWDQFVRDRIFQPLGMRRSNTSIKAQQGLENVARPHILKNGELMAVALRNYDNVGPAASINTCVLDLAQYMRMHINQGTIGANTLLSSGTSSEIFSAQISLDPRTYWAGMEGGVRPRFRAYGLGFRMQDYRGRKLVGHSGGIDGLYSLLTMIPEEGIGIVVLTNQQSSLKDAVTYTILDKLLGAAGLDWFSYYLRRSRSAQEEIRRRVEDRVESRIPDTKPSLSTDAYVGTYSDRMYGDIYFDGGGDRLTLRFSRTPSFTATVTHWHYDTFLMRWDDAMVPDGLVTFTLDSAGSVNGLKLDQPNLLDVDFSELEFVRKLP